MEPNEMTATETPRTTRSRSRLKAAVGGLVLAGLLAGGSASVFAASPEPTAADGAPATTEATTEATTDDSTTTGAREDCPDKERADTDADSSS